MKALVCRKCSDWLCEGVRQSVVKQAAKVTIVGWSPMHPHQDVDDSSRPAHEENEKVMAFCSALSHALSRLESYLVASRAPHFFR